MYAIVLVFPSKFTRVTELPESALYPQPSDDVAAVAIVVIQIKFDDTESASVSA